MPAFCHDEASWKVVQNFFRSLLKAGPTTLSGVR
jgi:hypothetical protein